MLALFVFNSATSELTGLTQHAVSGILFIVLGFDKTKLEAHLEKWVYSSDLPKLPMKNKSDVQRFIANVLGDDIFQRNFATSRDKWLDVDDATAFDWLVGFVGE